MQTAMISAVGRHFVPRNVVPLFICELLCQEFAFSWKITCGCGAGVVDICLIPEVDFCEEKLMEYIKKLLTKRGHTVRLALPCNQCCLSLCT
jgi:hypothetical protein